MNQILKSLTFALLGIASALLGMEALINVLYNAGGAFGIQDSASGSAWKSAITALGFAVVTFGCFFLTYKLARLAANRKNSD